MNSTPRRVARLLARLVPPALCLLLAACSGGGPDAAGAASSDGSPAVIVVAVDGLRADHLGSYGGASPTPNLDALAAESVRFDRAFAQSPEPGPSLATVLSGLYPTSSGVVAPGDRLPDDVPTLTEALKGAGLATAAFVGGLPEGDDLGVAQGFDRFEAAEPGDAALAWLREQGEGGFFLLASGWSLEESLAADGGPDGFAERLAAALADPGAALEGADLDHLRSLYAGHVAAVDDWVGRLLETLRETGLADRAAVALVGLRGASLQEHDPVLAPGLHLEVTRVPLLLRLPGGRDATTVRQVAEVVDLMPTVAGLAGAEAPATSQGRSLMELVTGEGEPPFVAFGEAPGGSRFIALSRYHMLLAPDGSTAGLYDVDADPGQTRDLGASDAERAEVLRKHVDAWQKMVSVASLDPELRSEEELDEETLEELRSLGYIQ